MARVSLAAILMLVPLAFACGGDDDAARSGDDNDCLEPLPRDCAIIWADYEAIHRNLLGATCGGSATGGSCHAPEGAMAGLVLSDVDDAYDMLLSDGSNGKPRVIPGDPECSEIVKRLHSYDEGYQMPPGGRLQDNELCSIVRWIADGAPRGEPTGADDADDVDDADAGP